MTAVEMLLNSCRTAPPAGLVDAHQDGGGIRVRQVEDGRSWLFRIPPVPGPSGAGSPANEQHARLHAELTARFHLAEKRIRQARETSAAVVRGEQDDRTAPAVVRAEAVFPSASVRLTISPPWSAEQIAARAELEQERQRRERLHRLASGPALRTVTVPLDDSGSPELKELPDDLRAVVEGAFQSAVTPSSVAVDPAPEPEQPADEPPEPDE